MRLLLTGDECGLIKEISITQTTSSSTNTSCSIGRSSTSNGVSRDREGLRFQLMILIR